MHGREGSSSTVARTCVGASSISSVAEKQLQTRLQILEPYWTQTCRFALDQIATRFHMNQAGLPYCTRQITARLPSTAHASSSGLRRCTLTFLRNKNCASHPPSPQIRNPPTDFSNRPLGIACEHILEKKKKEHDSTIFLKLFSSPPKLFSEIR